jgi:hypothetical protein
MFVSGVRQNRRAGGHEIGGGEVESGVAFGDGGMQVAATWRDSSIAGMECESQRGSDGELMVLMLVLGLRQTRRAINPEIERREVECCVAFGGELSAAATWHAASSAGIWLVA